MAAVAAWIPEDDLLLKNAVEVPYFALSNFTPTKIPSLINCEKLFHFPSILFYTNLQILFWLIYLLLLLLFFSDSFL